MPNPIINIRTVMVNTAITIAMLVNAFKSRVLGDGGTFEAENYLLTQSMSTINNAGFVLYASGYKTGKVYAFKPTNGAGDLTFTRSSSGYRFNPFGVLESIGSNIPRISYIGGIPTLLLEPLRTNIFLNSFAPVTQNITVVNGTVYTVSISGGTAALSGAGSGSAITGTDRTFTATGTTLTVTITGSPTYCQVEAGGFSTSPIATTGATATRVGDYYTVANPVVSNKGTWFVELLNNFSLPSDSAASAPYIGTSAITGTGGWSFIFRQGGGSQRANLWKYENGVGTQIFTPTTNDLKLAVTWNGTTANVYANGIKVVTNTSFVQTVLGFLASGNSNPVGRPFNIKSQYIFNEDKDDAFCIALTT
jgi:hypothetical protein